MQKPHLPYCSKEAMALRSSSIKMEKYMKKLALLFFTIICTISVIHAPKPPDLFGSTTFLDNTDYNLTFQDLEDAVLYNNAELARDMARFVRDIVASGVNPNQLCLDGFSPLHHAVTQNNILMVTYLLELGAAPNITDFNGQTPLHLAVQQNKPEIVALLLKDPRTKPQQFDNFGHPPLFYAQSRKIQALFFE